MSSIYHESNRTQPGFLQKNSKNYLCEINLLYSQMSSTSKTNKFGSFGFLFVQFNYLHWLQKITSCSRTIYIKDSHKWYVDWECYLLCVTIQQKVFYITNWASIHFKLHIHRLVTKMKCLVSSPGPSFTTILK